MSEAQPVRGTHCVHPRARHLELWDAPVRGRSLFAQRDASSYAELVTEVALAAAARHDAPRIFLAGGDPRRREVDEVLRRSGATVDLADDPLFVGEPAARAILARHPRTLAVDAGQTSLKIVAGERRWRAPRPERATGPRAFVDWIATFVRAEEPLDAWLIALPCQLEGGRGLSCSYFDTLDLAELAVLSSAPLSFCSDAELAAHSAILHWARLGVPPHGLVLTMGHGLGAAWVVPP